jgi:transforming growth factor-beta-induced protein
MVFRIVCLAAVFASSVLLGPTQKANAEDKDIVDTAVGAGQFSTLAAALQAADLVETLKGPGPFTVFAPTDAAFAKVDAETLRSLLLPENKSQLTGILTYHVVSGRVLAADAFKLGGAATVNGQKISVNATDRGAFINKSKLSSIDIICSNGVIHVIDDVMLPTSDTIPVVAEKAGVFATLLAAVTTAELAETLSGPGPFTVFAPTDEAFAKLPAGTVQSLLKPENRQQLVNLLTYHVASGRLYAVDLLKAGQGTSLQGSTFRVNASGGTAKVNAATLLTTDIDAANGVIHIIDSVLTPPMARKAAMAAIQNAVSQGAPLYNSGHHGQCAQVYMSAMTSILAQGVDGCDARMMKDMEVMMQSAAAESHMGERCWILRRGMDRMYSTIGLMQ